LIFNLLKIYFTAPRNAVGLKMAVQIPQVKDQINNASLTKEKLENIKQIMSVKKSRKIFKSQSSRMSLLLGGVQKRSYSTVLRLNTENLNNKYDKTEFYQ
jgi:predicted oxidoreductase (fatty acid repression mutant protein)